jgi:hypothetical protein
MAWRNLILTILILLALCSPASAGFFDVWNFPGAFTCGFYGGCSQGSGTSAITFDYLVAGGAKYKLASGQHYQVKH